MMASLSSLANNLLIPALAICGLVVLVALGKVGADVAVPLIVATAGVHTGAQIASPTTVVQSAPVSAQPAPIVTQS